MEETKLKKKCLNTCDNVNVLQNTLKELSS